MVAFAEERRLFYLCLSICPQDYQKIYELILMKLFEGARGIPGSGSRPDPEIF